ncbi:MAG: monovalent cation:proton antiporter-2 (CPA2) family protein [Pseudomonadota bacterium]
MDSHGIILNLVVYLGAAVIAVPLFARLGLGSVLGYLAAGVVIGPWGIGIIQDAQDILHFAEFGVVLLLFLIGLELEPRKLWNLRKPIVGAGGVQVGLTALVIFVVGLVFGLNWQSALAVGLALALSSTAIALQILGERNLMPTPAGQTGFSVLLFQDIAVIPIIALIPLLGYEQLNQNQGGGASTLTIVAVITGIWLVGRYVIHHIFRFVASVRLREVFTALSLLLVCGIAAIMDAMGISMALGAFLAGVILAQSEYRHALESDIEPFKGLLLGLFFMSVGMVMDFGLLFEQPILIVCLTVSLMLVKGAILWLVAKLNGLPVQQKSFFSMVLCQGGEFAFVLLTAAVTAGAVSQGVSDLLTLVVALSMAVTPILLIVNDRFIEPQFAEVDTSDFEGPQDEHNPVIIVGFGRFGQIVGRLLLANNITPTLIDINPDQITRVRRFGYKTYYGDVLREDVLHSAGAMSAKLIVLAIDDEETTTRAYHMIRREFPHLKVLARVMGRGHAMEMIDAGVDGFTRETFHSAMELSKQALIQMGFSEKQAKRHMEIIKHHDLETLKQQVAIRHDQNALIAFANTARNNLQETLRADDQVYNDADERSGDTK